MREAPILFAWLAVSGASLRRFAAYCLAAAVALPGPAAAEDVDALLRRMRDAMHPAVRMRADFAFEIEDDAGDFSRWTGDLVRDGAARSIRMRFQSPRDLAGVVFTADRSAEGFDQITLYLPFVRRTRTISGELLGTPFLGSDFNYEDLGIERLAFQAHRLDGQGEVDGRPCDRVVSTPSDSWWYGKIVRCVDREDHLPRWTEYFDRGGLRYKVRTLEDVRVIDSHPTPLRVRMRVVRDDGESMITLSDVDYTTD